MHPIKFIHCADIHIGAALTYLGTAAAKRRAEALLTLEKIVNIVREQNADLLLIAGDLFDANGIEPQLAQSTISALAEASPARVIIAAGNHDPLTASCFYRQLKLPENVFVLSTEDTCLAFDDIKTRVYGRSFAEVYMKSSESFSLDTLEDGYNNIMVLHGDISGDASSPYNSISSDFIRSSGMDYIALGHIHKRSEPQKLGNTVYAYSGCPEGQGFDETGEKGVYLGDTASGEILLQFIPCSIRQHREIHIDLSACTNEQEIISLVLDTVRAIPDYSEQLYKLVLKGALCEGLNVPTAELLSRLSSEVFFVKLRDKTTVKLDLELAAKENSLKGIFIRKMLEKRANATTDELPLIDSALDIGIRAFFSEVKYRDVQ